jgi:hypothetical protein
MRDQGSVLLAKSVQRGPKPRSLPREVTVAGLRRARVLVGGFSRRIDIAGVLERAPQYSVTTVTSGTMTSALNN